MYNQKKDAKKLIEEYHARENEFLDKIMKRLTKGNYEISISDFYPELNLEKKKPYTSRRFSYPVWVLLPYYANVIVHIASDYTERKFRKRYGVGVDELLDLQKEGRVSLILNLPTQGEKLPDYLFPLYQEGLQKGFPTQVRAMSFLQIVGGSNYEEGIEEGRSLFEGKLKEGVLSLQKHGISKEVLEILSIFNYSCLRGLGYHQICETIKFIAEYNPFLASSVADVYNEFLVDPIIRSLDGIHTVDKLDMRILKLFIRLGIGLPVAKANYEVFPFEIGKSLIKEAKLVVPNTLENALDVYQDFEEARRVLKNLEIAVEEKKKDLGDEKAALKEVWNEIYSMKAGVKGWTEILMSLGVVGSVGGHFLPGFPGLLVSLFGSLVSIKAKLLGERLCKIGKSRHVVAVYDFMEKRRKENQV